LPRAGNSRGTWHGSPASGGCGWKPAAKVGGATDRIGHLAFDRLADPATRQLPAFEARAGRWEELRWSLERIRHRFGEGRLWRATVERPHAALAEHRSRLVDIGQ
jgi:hypothetical protein